MIAPATEFTAPAGPAPWQAGGPKAALPLFAPCPKGLEEALASELTAFGAEAVAATGGGVAFTADWPLAVRINRLTRLASRILLRVAQGPYRNDRDLYRLGTTVAWEQAMGAAQTLRVDTRALRATVKSLNLVNLRIKDAIVDRLRTLLGERPSIDTRSPDVRVFVFLNEKMASLYLDLSGENLFKRGWRGSEDKGDAPLKENLAAGLLALCGWTPDQPLVDPFCGSGTIIIEAAQIAAGLAPGAQRAFGHERLLGSEPTPDAHAAKARAAKALPQGHPVLQASDLDPAAIRMASANLLRAGLPAEAVRFEVKDVLRVMPPAGGPGWLISNPPYGERLAWGSGGDEARELGEHLKRHWGGWQLGLLTSDLDLPGKLGMRARRRFPLMNGPLDCRLFVFEVR